MVLLVCTPRLFALTSEELVSMCRAAKVDKTTGVEKYDLQGCNGYVLGAFDMMMNVQGRIDKKTSKLINPQFICMPDGGVDTHELVLVFLKYMDDHPAQLHFPASITVNNAVNAAFHCPK